MGRKNRHGIRRKAKGGGKKWRPSPNDPVLMDRKGPPSATEWTDSVARVFKKKA